MEELGRKVAEKAAKGVLGKIKGALGIGEAEIEVSAKGIRARAPSVEKAKELVDYGVETLLKLPQTQELLSRADKRELEDPQVRSAKTKRSEDAQRLMEAPQVKALPHEEKLRFSIFTFIAHGDESFHSAAFPEAEKAYRQAYEFAQKLDDKPLHAICLNLIGAALGMQAEHEKALPCFDEAIKLKPDYAMACYNKGVTLGELGQYKEALACFDEAIKLKPDFAGAWYNKGEALQKLGLESISSGDMKGAEERALQLVKLKSEAAKDGMAEVVNEAVLEFKGGLSKKELKLFDEFEVMFTFLAIEDPFERWRFLKREIGKRWPKGVSAVEAIREQREG